MTKNGHVANRARSVLFSVNGPMVAKVKEEHDGPFRD
jgi:hypothetical protein